MRAGFTTTLLLGSAQTFAQTAATGKFADPAVVTARTSVVSNMGQVTLALVAVLAVLFVAAWMMRRFKVFNAAGQGAITVLQGVSLGPKERAILISVNGQRLLLGVAPGCVNLLMQLPPEDNPTIPEQVSSPQTAPDFKALLKRSMGLS